MTTSSIYLGRLFEKNRRLPRIFGKQRGGEEPEPLKEGGEMTREIQGYLSAMNELRDQIKSILEGLPEEALDWRPIEGQGELATNSLGAIVIHLAGSATYLIKEIIGGQPVHRDREAEFATRGAKASALKARLDEAVKIAGELLSPLKEDQMEEDRKYRDRTAKVRWIILHVIEHTAQHLGHMQLTRQLWLARNRK
jgi:hypothetical protein